MFSFSFNTVNAAINQTYSESVGTSNTEDSAIEEKVKSTVILDALASFVFAVASIVENLVGNIFKSLTGSTDFPWADRIIFNSISLLDVNFFNASEGSFFKTSDGSDTVIARVVRNTYFSVLAITIAFLTIVVAIAATKMVISTLATEKAKYKEAITKWLSSIILIFLMHNLMAFIFYVNEGLVEVASSILVKNMEGVGDELQAQLTISGEEAEQRVKNFIEQNDGLSKSNKDLGQEILNDEQKVTIANELLNNSEYREVVMKYASESSAWEHLSNFWASYFWEFTSPLNADAANHVYMLDWTIKAVQDPDHIKVLQDCWYPYKGLTKEEVQRRYEDENDMNWFDKAITTKDGIYDDVRFYITLTEAATAAREALYSSDGTWVGVSASDNKFDIIGNMAKYFKYKSWNFERDEGGNLTGWKASKVSVTGALLYAIFLAQSILYFFSYVKRFFYIVILAILAPVIVLFDFLGKAVG